MIPSLRKAGRGWGALAAYLSTSTLAACSNAPAGGETGSAGAAMGAATAGAGVGGNLGVAGAGAGAGGSSVGGSATAGSAGALGTAGDGAVSGSPGASGASGTAGASSGGNGGTAGAAGGAAPVAGAGGIPAGGAGGGAGAPASMCPPATPLTGGQKYCSNAKGNVGGGYSYERWASGSGSGCMTVFGVAANFSATWTDVGDFLARIGLGLDQTKTPAQLGTISAEFAETKTADNGLVYVGIYGWSVSPLREYYIIDDWGSSKPAGLASDGSPRTHAGTITVDGDTYDVWTHTQTNKPAINSDSATFDQYFSVRQSARQCGHVSVSEHFSKWAALGLSLGKMEEVKLLVEAQSSTGTVNFTTASIVIK